MSDGVPAYDSFPAPGVDSSDVLKDPCSEQEIAAEADACAEEFDDSEPQYEDNNTDFLDLRKAAYKQKLGVSRYTTHLGAYEATLATLKQDLVSYELDCSGKTYATSALTEQADELTQRGLALIQERANVQAEFDEQNAQADQEEATKSQILSHLDDLIKESQNFLASLVCVRCSSVEVLLARAQSLRERCERIRIVRPAVEPDAVPAVPRLPNSPRPPNVASPPPHASRQAQNHWKAQISRFGKPKKFLAGEVWPKLLPVEGGARVCAAVFFEIQNNWNGTDPMIRPKNGTVGWVLNFTKNQPPTVTITGGRQATDVQVSEDGTHLFFTVYNGGQPFSAGIGEITITDADGTEVTMASADPGTSLTFTPDISEGVAAMHASLLIGMDSAFESVSRKPTDAIFQAFLAKFKTCIEAQNAIQASIWKRTSEADSPRWAGYMRLDDVMFRTGSRTRTGVGDFWDYDYAITPGAPPDHSFDDSGYSVWQRSTSVVQLMAWWLYRLSAPAEPADSPPPNWSEITDSWLLVTQL